ncbi:kinase-like domain-containing protein [Mycena polygramma]|nr:kinase-like domain-containing protein [Mycena polygramma]
MPSSPDFVNPDTHRDHDIGVIIGWLDELFHEERDSYNMLLACRGTAAQKLLDLLQDALDYDPYFSSISRRRLFTALKRLSGASGLHPRCFPLPDLQLGKQVAGGNFGDVYSGSLHGQNVAIKMMRIFGETDINMALQNFGREAIIWRQLSHPNLLPFFGLYYHDGRLCLVSPWMENGDIRTFLNESICNIDSRVSSILDVALGLKHLHGKHVIHGDLKTANILVTSSHRACIADFGLSSTATAISSFQFTHSSNRPRGGTVRYQAPELLRGGHNNTESDVYAFACVAYELLTQQPPFAELRLEVAVITKILEGSRPAKPTSHLKTTQLHRLWDLIQDCWKEQPEMRPTADQIVQQLMGPAIQAQTTLSSADWDETFTSKFRRSLHREPPLPSIPEIERMIRGDGESSRGSRKRLPTLSTVIGVQRGSRRA